MVSALPVSTSLENLVSGMTVAELAQRSGHSVATLVELAFGSRAAAAPAIARPAKGKRGAAKGKRGAKKAAASATKPAPKAEGAKKAGVDTRAPSSRAKFDESVLATIKGAKGRIKAADLRKRLGGTPLQMRTALHRLLAEGKIKSHGKARGTTYSG